MKFLDIYSQDKPILNKIYKDIKKVIKKSDFIMGEKTKEFEQKFAKYCTSKFAIGCGNCTDALYIAIKSLHLPKNSEVIIPAMTYCSTAFSIIEADLKPILVDTEKFCSTIDIQKLKTKITNKTKVIMPVHLYGSTVNIREIKKIINKKKFI